LLSLQSGAELTFNGVYRPLKPGAFVLRPAGAFGSNQKMANRRLQIADGMASRFVARVFGAARVSCCEADFAEVLAGDDKSGGNADETEGYGDAVFDIVEGEGGDTRAVDAIDQD
jgi:hypothetical protein